MNNINKNIILAGVGRSGKTTISRMLACKLNFRHIAMDSIIEACSIVYPEINIRHSDLEETSHNIAKMINTMSYSLKHTIFDLDKLLPEEYVRYINKEKNDIYFIIYSNLNLEEKYMQVRKYDTIIDYSKDFNEEKLKSWLDGYIKRSKIIKEQCDKYNLRYIDTSNNRIEIINNFVKELSLKYGEVNYDKRNE